MLHQQRELRNVLAQATDALFLGLSLYAAHLIRFSASRWLKLPQIQGFDAFFPLFLFVTIFGPVILDSRSLYRYTLFDRPYAFFVRLAQALFLIVVLMTLLMYLFQMNDLARGVIVIFAVEAFLMISTRHFIVQNIFDLFFHGNNSPHAVLIVGDAEGAEKTRRMIELQQDFRMTVVGVIRQFNELEKELAGWLHRAPISGVIFNVPPAALTEVQKAIELCELEGVEAWLVTDYIRSKVGQPLMQEVQGHPVLVFPPREVPGWQIVAKRVLDITLSLVGLVLFSPLMALVALGIRLESKGPAVFVQERSGQRGRVFRMYKFRSMVCDAATQQEELAAYNEMEGGPVFKISNDPRVTRCGAVLRRTSLDELPQLWNVLRGEMSLVGPRPLPVYETRKIMDSSHRRRLSIKPGLTCLWQIAGRNQIRNFDEWMKLDLEYVDSWTFWMDLKIVMKTIPVVITGLGAR